MRPARKIYSNGKETERYEKSDFEAKTRAGNFDRLCHNRAIYVFSFRNSREDIEKLAQRMKTDYAVEAVAPAHCTGHLGFLVFKETFGGKGYKFFGLGETLRMEPPR